MRVVDLIAFEAKVKRAVEAGEVKGPVHLSGGNEDQLIKIFESISMCDHVFSTYRSHYHALLKRVDPDWLFAEILAGRSMSIQSPSDRFHTSAIVGGCLAPATGLAAALKRNGSPEKVWCFIGDMAASTGTFHNNRLYAACNDLPITYVVEDNGYSTDTPTWEAWGSSFNFRALSKTHWYFYKRTTPHIGATAEAVCP